MLHRSFASFILAVCLLTALLPPAPAAAAPRRVPPELGVQAFLDEQPGPLKTYRDGERTAAEIIQGASAYYGVSPRILLALLEAAGGLLSSPVVPADQLRMPFGPAGPEGFAAQIDWAAREIRAGYGPYEHPPTLYFSDGSTRTITLAQAPEGVAVQRFLARGRTQSAWLAAIERFNTAFTIYFNNELPDERPAAPAGFLKRPWPAGTRVVHLAYFDHTYPTVDRGVGDNGVVVNYLGQGGVQYDGHDGHDYYFPDQPIGTPIYAAADGMAYARTHRGLGVFIVHADGYETVYWHLDKFSTIFRGLVDTDQGVYVRAGDLLGTSGKTGFVQGTPHLHFEVRHNGRQVDPYGWYGPGPDPCPAYAACEASVWLWHPDLIGEGDFTPPDAGPLDTDPPVATIALAPPEDLPFIARFDESPLQQVGAGEPIVEGNLTYRPGRFGNGVALTDAARLAYPTEQHLSLDSGTLALWAELPAVYPATSTGRVYLLAASANPGSNPVYTGTLALRREESAGTAHWNFWTTPESGEEQRNDLRAPDQLEAGWHHFAITWDRARGSKALYIDGVLAAAAEEVVLPANVGPLLELGRFASGGPPAGVTLDELALFNRALDDAEVAQLATAERPLRAGASRVATRQVTLDLNGFDSGSTITSLQIGIDDRFSEPHPFDERFLLTLPDSVGTHSIAVRLFDRSGNTTTVSETIIFDPEPLAHIDIEHLSDRAVTLTFIPRSDLPGVEVQLSNSPQRSGATWHQVPAQVQWSWPAGARQVIWVRFRDSDGNLSPAQAVGPEAQQAFLPAAIVSPASR